MNRRDRELEKWLKTKAAAAPTPELPFEPSVYAAEESPVSSSSPVAPAGRHMGIAAIAAAAAVVILCGTVLTFWRLSDALPIGAAGSGSTAVSEEPPASADTPSTIATTSPFDGVTEVPGYDAYKADLIEKSKIAETITDFQPDKETFILTYRAVECNMTGSGKDSFVAYMLAQKSDEQHGSFMLYDYFIVYVLISDGKPVAYTLNQDLSAAAEMQYRNMTLQAAGFDGDGADEIWIKRWIGGSGGSQLLTVYHYDSENLIKYPIGKEDRAYTLEATVEPEGYYVMYSDATGYEERFRLYNWEDEWAQEAWEDTMEHGIYMDPTVNFAVTDLNHDGISEINVVHNYWHYVHVESIGYGVEIFQYDSELGYFQSIWTTYFSEEEADKRLFSDDFPALLEEIVQLDDAV